MESDHRDLLLKEKEDSELIVEPKRENYILSLRRPLQGASLKPTEDSSLYLIHFYHVIDLRKLSRGENPELVEFYHADFWVQVHDLRHGFASENLARSLGSGFGWRSEGKLDLDRFRGGGIREPRGVRTLLRQQLGGPPNFLGSCSVHGECMATSGAVGDAKNSLIKTTKGGTLVHTNQVQELWVMSLVRFFLILSYVRVIY
ncbi:hypothetical protein Golob_003510 [Gossypium lobatum]|uniref:DUF4283 domain-containing protein n=1 Tax=Gossypium lobatum TaxID=34289 RepID=A0A7J8MYS8_9ROSI|nr:hypothetical protein [Gossypium lobatum]